MLASAVENLSGADPQLADAVDQVRPLVASGNRSQARKLLQSMLAALPADSGDCRDVIDALITVLSTDS